MEYPKPIMNCFTVDVEDWFHILDCPGAPTTEDWGEIESRVQGNLQGLLCLMAEHGVHGTFFVLGWIAEQHPELVRTIADQGHEIACHGHMHELLNTQSQSTLATDLSRAREAIIAACDVAPIGYRAPGFSITSDTLWALDTIKEAGFEYDSSLLSCHHGHGGSSYSGYIPSVLPNGLIELPVSVAKFYGREVPFGGGYLRIMTPQGAFKRASRIVTSGQCLISYVHPRDLDPDQPRIGMNPVRRFKTYVGLRACKEVVSRLLGEFEWNTMAELSRQVGSNKEPILA